MDDGNFEILHPFDAKVSPNLSAEAAKWKANERLPAQVYERSGDALERAVNAVVAGATEKRLRGERYALGLGFGSAVGAFCETLARRMAQGAFSLQGVTLFVLAEFYPLAPDRAQSTRRFIEEHLFEGASAPADCLVAFRGDVLEQEVAAELQRYTAQLAAFGGVLDAVVLDLEGRGRLLFTDVVTEGSLGDAALLAEQTELSNVVRSAYSSMFFGYKNVCYKALSASWSVLLNARSLLLLAFGESHASTLRAIVQEPPSTRLPASLLQTRSPSSSSSSSSASASLSSPRRTLLLCDEAAAASLTRFDAPWLLPQITLAFDGFLERKAVIWLSLKLGRPILRLTASDYESNSLAGLLRQRGPVFELNSRVFSHLSSTVTDFPAGGGGAAQNVEPRRVMVFSPHPDDDVISMGGTFARLAHQGHEVHVCYQTSGNYAVRDDDVLRALRFSTGVLEALGKEPLPYLCDLSERVAAEVSGRPIGAIDSSELLKLKALVRRGEAESAALYCGIHPKRIHFLNLPFYETGKLKKNPISQRDIDIVRAVLTSVRPQQIYVAGDLSDPHGTHRVCLNAVFQALAQLHESEAALPTSSGWFRDGRGYALFLYRGAWQEWEPEKITMAVPLSPLDVLEKRYAIFRHQSQKDPPPFPGSDDREFWVRTESRNRNTASLLDRLGLIEYEAVEAFVEWSLPQVQKFIRN